MRLGDTEWREALQREALQREALEREAIERELLHRQAALMGYGGFGGFQGIGGQEAEYLHQLHLEALVQQRRQEALAQLAIAHEMGMSPDVHALLQAQQRRQTALLQQEMLLSSGVNPDVLSQDSSIARVVGAQDRTWSEGEQRREETLRKEKYEQQQKLANLSFGGSTVDASAAFLLKAATALSSPDLASSDTNCKGLVAPSIAKDIDKQSSKPKPARLAEDTESRFTMIPCPARGMPSDHNAISAFFKISDDVEHGANLVCSYYACRNSGAQVRTHAYFHFDESDNRSHFSR